MKPRKQHKANGGWSLIEVLLYGALLIVVVNAGMRISLSAGRVSAINALAKDRLIAVQEMDAEFRDAVRGTSGVLPAAGGYTTGDSVIVLRLDGDNRVRVVGAVTQPDNFGWVELAHLDGEWNVVDMRNFTLPVQDLSVKRHLESSRLVALEYELVPERGERMHNSITHRVLANMQCAAPEAVP